MAWHLAVSDRADRPFAVVDGKGQVAGCHSTRAAATIQMTQLNLDDDSGVEEEALDEKGKKKAEKKEKEPTSAIGQQVPWQAPPVAYTTPTTQLW